jgi:predicted transcriptional regulator
MAANIVISIRPEHVHNILIGRKTVELRRRFPEDMPAGCLLLIYASRPHQALVGAARIDRVQRMVIDTLWQTYKAQACVPWRLFVEYFAGATEGYGVVLGGVVRFNKPIPASELRERFRLSPPQSYCYIRGHLVGLLDDERIQVPDRHEYRDRP